MTDSLTGEKLWNQKWVDLGEQPVNEFAIKLNREYLSYLNKDISILDLGCGHGVDSEYFYNNGYKKITAVDFSSYGIDLINQKININTIKENIENVEFKNNSFDIVYAHLSLHYFKDNLTKKLFKKCFEWLKDDGLLCVKCKSVNDKEISSGIMIEKDTYQPKGKHIRHLFSKDYMKECIDFASDNKGKIISINEVNGAYHTNPNASFIEAIYKK